MIIFVPLVILCLGFRGILWIGGLFGAPAFETANEAGDKRIRSGTGVLYLVLLAFSAGITICAHSFLGLFSATLMLGISTAWRMARAVVRNLPLVVWTPFELTRSIPHLRKRVRSYEREALLSYQTMILMACVATLASMVPHFVSWFLLPPFSNTRYQR